MTLSTYPIEVNIVAILIISKETEACLGLLLYRVFYLALDANIDNKANPYYTLTVIEL